MLLKLEFARHIFRKILINKISMKSDQLEPSFCVWAGGRTDGANREGTKLSYL